MWDFRPAQSVSEIQLSRKKEGEKGRLQPDRCPTSVEDREDKSTPVLSEAADIDGMRDVLPRTSNQRIRPNEHPRGDRSGGQADPAACRAFKDGVNSVEEALLWRWSTLKTKRKKKPDVFWETFFFFCCVAWLLSHISATQLEEILSVQMFAMFTLRLVMIIVDNRNRTGFCFLPLRQWFLVLKFNLRDRSG